MTDKITLEDINTWFLKYDYQTIVLTLDCSRTGDFGFYYVDMSVVYRRLVTLRLPPNFKLYYSSGAISYNSSNNLVTLSYGDFQLTVVLNPAFADESEDVVYEQLVFDWRPVSPTKILALTNDELNNKLYLEIKNEDITQINYSNIQDLDTNPYVTYDKIFHGAYAGDEVWTNIDDASRYPCKLINIPSAPHITIEKSLYRGNTNNLDDLISLPSEDIEYSIYYQNKKIETLFLPEDYSEDNIRLRVITKSYEPYINIDIYITVPVETKELTSIDDLNNYSYGYINQLSDVSGEINNPIHLIGETDSSISNADLTINADVVFDGITEINNSKITVNGDLNVTNSKLTPNNYFLFDNNGVLTVDNCTSDEAQNLVLNKGTLTLSNNTFDFDSLRNFPCIHSENSPTIQGNYFNYIGDVAGYGVCIIRTNDLTPTDFLTNNTVNYDCNYDNNEVTYVIRGNGISYCKIDEDTIIFNNLEVE